MKWKYSHTSTSKLYFPTLSETKVKELQCNGSRGERRSETETQRKKSIDRESCPIQARTADSWVQPGSEVMDWQQWGSEEESQTTGRHTHTHTSGRGDKCGPLGLSFV